MDNDEKVFIQIETVEESSLSNYDVINLKDIELIKEQDDMDSNSYVLKVVDHDTNAIIGASDNESKETINGQEAIEIQDSSENINNLDISNVELYDPRKCQNAIFEKSMDTVPKNFLSIKSDADDLQSEAAWDFFFREMTSSIAKCLICDKMVEYKNSIENLQIHLQKKHVFCSTALQRINNYILKKTQAANVFNGVIKKNDCTQDKEALTGQLFMEMPKNSNFTSDNNLVFKAVVINTKDVRMKEANVVSESNEEEISKNLSKTHKTNRFSCNDPSSLTVVTTKSKDIEYFQCNCCKQTFLTQQDLSKHIKIHAKEAYADFHKTHSNLNESSNIFENTESLNENSVTEPGRKHQCSHCAKSFKTRKDWTSHVKTHTAEKLYKCLLCGKTFAKAQNVKRHMRVHSGEKTSQCEICKKYFSDNGARALHMRIHTNERPYKCCICDATFTQTGHLETHKLTHLDLKVYSCAKCGKEYANKVYYINHVQKKTCCKCSICNCGFPDSKQLSKHIKLHGNDESHSLVIYKCPSCPESFKTREKAKTHLLSHKK